MMRKMFKNDDNVTVIKLGKQKKSMGNSLFEYNEGKLKIYLVL